jgi:hypothetical protein
VYISTQKSFKSVITFNYDKVNIPSFTFENFTSNDTSSCAVIKHEVVFASSSSGYAPQISLTEGSS